MLCRLYVLKMSWSVTLLSSSDMQTPKSTNVKMRSALDHHATSRGAFYVIVFGNIRSFY